MPISLHVVLALNRIYKPLGWCAVALRQENGRWECLNFGHFSQYEQAIERTKAVPRFIADWEFVASVTRDLEEVVAHFSARDGLEGRWTQIRRKETEPFDPNTLTILFDNDDDLQVDLSFDERLVRGVTGVPDLFGTEMLAQQSELVLRQLSHELGRAVTETEAVSLSETWGASRVAAQHWAIEVVPAVGDKGEAVGYSVIGLIYENESQQRARMFDLAEPVTFETAARSLAIEHRINIGLLLRLPCALVHRDGLEYYFAQARKDEGVNGIWEPIDLDGEALLLLLTWAVPLRRGSMLLDGSMSYAEVRQALLDIRIVVQQVGELDPKEKAQLREYLGCEDTEDG